MASYAGCFLEAPDGRVLDLEDWDAGYIVEQVDIGAPNIREAVNDRPLAHGTFDYTRWSGARTVTLNMALVPGTSSRRRLLDGLAPFLDPGARSTLHVATDKLGPYRQIQVRASGDLSAPWERPPYVRVTLGWTTVGSPMFRSDDVHEGGFAWSVAGVPGRTYDLTFDRIYPESPAIRGLVINDGDQPGDWVAEIAGPLSSPAVHNLTVGQTVATTGLTVLRDQTLVIDSSDMTVMLDGISSRYGSLDFTKTSWWKLVPGTNVVILEGAGGQAGGSSATDPVTGELLPSACRIRWWDTYLF